MSKIVVFGVQDFAELAHYYLTNDSQHEIVAFTVSKEYYKDVTFLGLPVVPFEDVENMFPPTEYKMFAPMSAGKDMNKSRANIYTRAKDKGYELISYISSHATVLTENIGDNCFILEDNTIQPFVTIGNNVILWSGNHIGHHSTIHDHVFFTSHVVVSGHCDVGAYSFLGVNATLRDGLKIAENSFIAMSASITKNTSVGGRYKGYYSEIN
ncbi:MAG: acetyltransferase [Clostridiales bacterium]|jgi:sugar O-acyltransferase (sialic acid O-acetyltransferase NeuD family)|nr:acetyltransferase [Clostridiales bacterium]